MAHALEVISPVVPQKRHKLATFQSAVWQQNLIHVTARDLNPIEQAFAKVKHWMRMARKRTAYDTWRHIGCLASTITPTRAPTIFVTPDTLPLKNDRV